MSDNLCFLFVIFQGKVIGVTIGCFLGMIPLLFFDHSKKKEKKEGDEKKDDKKDDTETKEEKKWDPVLATLIWDVFYSLDFRYPA